MRLLPPGSSRGRAGGASTTDVMLAGNWKTRRMVASRSPRWRRAEEAGPSQRRVRHPTHARDKSRGPAYWPTKRQIVDGGPTEAPLLTLGRVS